MYIDTTFPPDGPGAAARFQRMIDALPRQQIETVVEALIASLDARDGDIDLEDSEASETAISQCGRMLHVRTLADHVPGDDDGESEPAWQEWDKRDAKNRRRALHEPVGANTACGSEDDEDDDEDTCQAGDDGCAPFMTFDGPRLGSAYECSDREGIDDDREAGSWPEEVTQAVLRSYDDDDRDIGSEASAYAAHCDRIQRTRCELRSNSYLPRRVMPPLPWTLGRRGDRVAGRYILSVVYGK